MAELYNEWIYPILRLLNKTINELETRDAFMRIYQDDFRNIKDKNLYDEREWRSVKFISSIDIKSNPTIVEDANTKGVLPENYNLKFEADDIYEILVKNDGERNELIDFVNSELSHLKIVTRSIKIMV